MKDRVDIVGAIGRRLLLGAAAILIATSGVSQPVAAQEKEPVVLGFVTELSGSQAAYGQSDVRIGEMFADLMNEQGGIDGRKVELAVGDNQEQPDVFISLGRRYIAERNVTGFFGLHGSGMALAFSKAIKSTKVPIFLHFTWGNENTGPDLPSVFRVGPYNAYIATLMTKYLVDTGYKSVVALAEDTAFGTDLAAGLEQAVGDRLDLTIIPYQHKTLDLSPVLTQLAQQDPQPDAVIVAGNYQIIYNLPNQMREAGLKSQIIGTWDYPASDQYWDIAGENGVGTIYASFSGPSMPLTPTGHAFREKFVERFDREPVFYEYFLWDGLNALRVAVESSGSVDPAVLTEALPKVEFEGTMGVIRYEQEPDSLIWNQALVGKLFVKKLTAVGQTDAEAEIIYEAAP